MPSQHESQQIDDLNESWIINTNDRIDSSRGVDGGYGNFPPEKPTLYSTYYFLESLDILNEEPNNKQATIKWLLSEEQVMFEQTNDTTMRKIYFLTMSLDILDAKPSNRSRIISKVMELQMPDGSFADEKGDDGMLLDTFRAINILNTLGVDLNDIPSTKKWLINKSLNAKESDNLVQSLGELSMSMSSLDLYNSNNAPTSKKSKEREEWTYTSRIFTNSQLNSLSENQLDLFKLNLFTEILATTDGITPEIMSDVGIYLKGNQLDDGGFNTFLDVYGESQGTYLAIKIASNCELKLNDGVHEFIHEHELPSGGFRPAYRLISSPENTYLAVSSLKILSAEPSHIENLTKYLETEWGKGHKRADQVYYLLMTYALINQSPQSEIQTKMWIKTELENFSTKPIESMDLREFYYLIKVANMLDVELNDKGTLVSRFQTIQNGDGGFGFKNSDTYSTFLVVNILSELDAHPLDESGCTSWIKEAQSNDGGFIFRRGEYSSNNSDLYSTYLSTSSLENMNSRAKNPEGLFKWLRDCQDETGGFRLAPKYSKLDATPESLGRKIEYTGWGLAILDIYDR